MLKHIEIDGRLYGHSQVLKLIACLRDRHGFEIIVTTIPNLGLKNWICSLKDVTTCVGTSLWDCVSQAANHVQAKIERERKGGN